MARSSYIYIVEEIDDSGGTFSLPTWNIMRAFTVKHEMLTYVKKYLELKDTRIEYLRCFRIADGAGLYLNIDPSSIGVYIG